MTDFKNTLMNVYADDLVEQLYTQYKEVLDSLDDAYIWGAGLLGYYALRQFEKAGIRIKGIVDKDENKQKEPGVYSPNILTHKDTVIIAAAKTSEIQYSLEQMGNHTYMYYEILPILDKRFDHYCYTFDNWLNDIEQHKNEYMEIYERLNDNISKEIYEYVMLYRMTLDTKWMRKAHERSALYGKQYFDAEIVKPDEKAIFVDGGGFLGESTLDFIEFNPKYKKVYFFEPDQKIYEEAKENLKLYPNIEMMKKGLGRSDQKVVYHSALKTGGGFFAEDINGEASNIVSLDDYFAEKEKPTYIKLDIEGFEAFALEGMRRIISENRPVLAISIYHKAGDIYKLIKYILSLYSGYKVAVRHYSDEYYDTIAYFY